MKVYITEPGVFGHEPPRLFLHAQSERDEKILRQLADGYVLTNFGTKDYGRVADHVAIELTPKAEVFKD